VTPGLIAAFIYLALTLNGIKNEGIISQGRNSNKPRKTSFIIDITAYTSIVPGGVVGYSRFHNLAYNRRIKNHCNRETNVKGILEFAMRECD
jgi:hypothetical protein